MKNLAQASSSGGKNHSQFNPFAKALAETEHESFDRVQPNLNPFSEALAKTGGSFSSALDTSANKPDLLEEQKKNLLAEQEKQLLRKKLHDKVNPVETTEIFIQDELKTKRALEQLRQELVFLVEDIKQFRKELAIATQQRIVSPGISGTYHYNFFNQLRSFVVLVRKSVKEASTWIHTTNGKKQKTKGVQATKSAHDKMFHEQKVAFAGG